MKKDFFDNFNNCYWAGFISADGSLQAKKGRYYAVLFDLSSKDRCLLEKLKKEAETANKIVDYSREKNGKIYFFSRFSLSSVNEVEKLNKDFYITSNKTYEYNPPKEKFSIQQRREFIKGVIDGDGSIRIRPKDNTFNIKILGTSGNLEMIVDHCNFLGLDLSYSKIKPYYGTKVLDLWGKNARTLFIDLYQNVENRLERKWKKDFFIHCVDFLKRV